MKTFNVYKHPTQGIEAVKIGFSWPAFFFGIIWMLVKKLWGLAGAWFAVYIVLSLIEKVTDQSGEGGAQALVYPGLLHSDGIVGIADMDCPVFRQISIVSRSSEYSIHAECVFVDWAGDLFAVHLTKK